LNHHYRIVWSQVLNAWVAVSEIARGQGKSKTTRTHVVNVLTSIGLLVFPMTSSALDLPSGAKVTAGAATVQTTPNAGLQINQSTPRAVIRWNDFSVGQGKQVTFAQPNAGAATLNVVTGNNSSVIAGTLKANGAVYLINQNGIAITPTGLVDTRAGFIASTLRMDENAFMEGKNVFSGQGGSVVNRGQILVGPGGTVGLLGSTVANEGLISVPLGKVVLASGEAATLDLSGDGFLQLMLPSSALAGDGQALVSNSGVIQADGGLVVLTAATVRQALREAVNMSGNISARTVSGQNGAIVLEGGAGGNVRVAGSLATDGEATGGRIDVTGASVALEGATLSATGSERGGLVRVGGAFQGGREQPADSADAALFAGRFGSVPVIASATTTTVDAASTINVSATGSAGTGGTAIVWSDSTTVMQGAIAARGAASGGAVEVSAKSTIQSIDLKRIVLGRGGTLLLDPQDIVIDRTGTDAAANTSYATPGTITHLLEADITALLSTGANVSLQASQDISWLDNFSFVTRTPTAPGGDLNLTAGRSVTLSGIFHTADGNWTIVANDTAAHGVVDAERGTGAAEIDLRNANFINNNGNLSLTLADGAGNTHHEADRITLGRFNGNGLTATIASTATPAYGATRILLTDDINVSGAISLTGDLQVSPMGPVLSLSGQSVTWNDEKTGGTLFGEGAIKFIENGVITRIGQLGYGDAARVELSSQPELTRVYGDDDPGLSDLAAPMLQVAAHSGTAIDGDALSGILAAGSVSASGPGVFAGVGSNSVTVSATASAAFAPGLYESYFVDLTAVSVPLSITPRTVTAIATNGAYTYGSPDAIASLSGLVNGDALAPVATLNGVANVEMGSNGAGFGFDPRVQAGVSSFNLTGLAGAQAGNYLLDTGTGNLAGALNIAPKAISYVVGNGGQVYGSTGTMPVAAISGVLSGDTVTPIVALLNAGQAVGLDARTPAATYDADVVSLAGTDADNYILATSGNGAGRYTVNPKIITVDYAATAITSTYGDMADLAPGVSLIGVLAGDAVTPDLGNYWLDYRTPAGDYTWTISGLQGSSSGNYVVHGTTDSGRLTINKRTISYFGGEISQVYGQATLPSPFYLGVLPADLAGVTAPQVISYPSSYASSGSGTLPVGSYQVDLGDLTGGSAGNYVLDRAASTPQRVTVTPKPVGVSTFDDMFSTYGTPANLAGAVIGLSGIESGDAVTGQAHAFNWFDLSEVNSRSNVGTYALGLQGLNGADAANYMVQDSHQRLASLIVNPKEVSVTFGNPSRSFVYGEAVNLNPTIDDVLSGDDVNAMLTTTTSSNQVATASILNTGEYRTGATALEGSGAGNYRLINNTPTLFRITPRPLAYTMPEITTIYGSPVPDNRGGIAFSNLVGQDEVGVASIGFDAVNSASLSGYFPGNTVMSDRSPAGYYMMSVTGLSGAAAANYMLAPPSASSVSSLLTILPKTISASSGIVNSVYGSPITLGLSTLDGVLPGDTVNVGPTTLADGSLPNYLTNAGNYSLRSQIWGAHAANYTVQNNGLLSIAPKDVVPTFVIAWNGQAQPQFGSAPVYGTYYRPTGTMSPSDWTSYGIQASVVLNGVIHGQEVSQTVLTAPDIPFSSSGAYRVGTYEWQLSAQLTGTDASNYRLAANSPTVKSWSIVPKPVSSRAKVMDGAQEVGSAVYGNTAGLNLVAEGAPDIVSTPFGRDDAVLSPFFGAPGMDIQQRYGVGTYQTGVYLSGADGANYTQPINLQDRFDITPRPLSIGISNSGPLVYGVEELPWTYTGLLPGDQVQAVSYVCGSTLGGQYNCGTTANASARLPFRTSAGHYTATVTDLSGVEGGQDARNYTWEIADESRSGHNQIDFFIGPRQLTWREGAGALAMTYGDTMPTIRENQLSGLLLGANYKGDFTNTPIDVEKGQPTSPTANARLNVGDYGFSGMSADSNYLMPSGMLTVAPKPLVYAITDVSGQYGNYKDCATPGCAPWVAGIDLGQIIVPGAFVGDQLGGTIGLLDTTGKMVLLDEKTPVGNYFQVLTSLTGASAPNYVVAYSGSAPGVLSITPMWLSYTTSSAVFVGNSEFGLVGKPGVATVRGPNGTPINGDDVKGSVAMMAPNGRFVEDATAEFQNLSLGRYTFPVVGLSGEDAGNYRILPNEYSSATAYGKNEIGTLVVFPDTTLNLLSTSAYAASGASTANTRLAAALPVYMPDPINTGITVVDQNGTAGGAVQSIASTATGVLSDLRGSEQVAVNTTANTQTELGNAELSAQATAGASALAQYGLTGINLVASANAGATVRVDFGPGYSTAQASTQALVSAKLNPTGLTVIANAGASAQAEVGYASSTDAGRVTLGTTATANAGASGTAKAGYSNGSVGFTKSGSVGASVSVGGTAGLSGDVGSVEATAAVTSPGSFGGSGGGNVGYSEGKLKVSFEFGADLGIGGFKLKMDTAIDVGSVKDFLTGDLADAATDIGNAIGCGIGVGGCPSRPPPPSRGEIYVSKTKAIALLGPVAKYAFLMSNSKWRDDLDIGTGYSDMQLEGHEKFIKDFDGMRVRTEYLRNLQAEKQRGFLQLLATSPSEAIALSRTDLLDPDMKDNIQYQRTLISLKEDAIRLNIGIAFENGQFIFRDVKPM